MYRTQWIFDPKNDGKNFKKVSMDKTHLGFRSTSSEKKCVLYAGIYGTYFSFNDSELNNKYQIIQSKNYL